MEASALRGAAGEAPRLGVRRQALLSFLWLVFNFEWGAFLIVLPAQVARVGGDLHKVHDVGVILPLGALVALVVTPLAGALSDRSGARIGRRSAFLVAGGILNVAFLGAMAWAGEAAHSLVLLTLCWLGVQFGANWWGGPYAGLIPDQVPQEERGAASGWMMAMTSVGSILGAVAAASLLPLGYGSVYAAIAALLAGGIALTVLGVREWETPAAAPRPAAARPAAKAPFFPDPRRHADFYLVLVTRALLTMSSFTVIPFFAFFLRDAFRLPSVDAASQWFGVLLGAASILALPAALLSGRWADRNGPLRAVWLGSWITAGCAAALALVAAQPSVPALVLVALLLAQGSAIYQATDWALAIAVLPSLGDAGRYMGIWHISFVLPQSVAPFLAGLILGVTQDEGATAHAASAYAPLFLLAAFWAVCGTLPLRLIRSVR